MRVEIYTNSHFEEIKFGELLRLKYGGWINKESAWSVGDLGSVPGLERCLVDGIASHSSILGWRIPWTEEPSGLQFMGLPRVDMTERLSTAHETQVRS